MRGLQWNIHGVQHAACLSDDFPPGNVPAELLSGQLHLFRHVAAALRGFANVSAERGDAQHSPARADEPTAGVARGAGVKDMDVPAHRRDGNIIAGAGGIRVARGGDDGRHCSALKPGENGALELRGRAAQQRDEIGLQ